MGAPRPVISSSFIIQSTTVTARPRKRSNTMRLADPHLRPTTLALPTPHARRGNLRRTLGLVTLAWVFGSVWATATGGAPLTLFAHSLGATEFQFGLLSALPFIASLIQMPASALI